MFTGLDGDMKYSRQMDKSSAQIESLLVNLGTSSNQAVLDSLATLTTSWNDYKNILQTNRDDMVTRGYADVRLMDELGKLNISLVNVLDNLYTGISENSSENANQWVEVSRKQGVLIQLITAQYAARSNSNLGQVFTGSVTDKSIDELAADFSRQLGELQKSPANSSVIKKELRSIKSKWSFISKSLNNYNENSVPFLVTKYGERIVSSLDKVAALYAQ